jgi:putative ABC transport system permease protein
MNDAVIAISLWHLALAFIPVVVTLAVFLRWSQNTRHALYALARMLVQLLLIGYVLAYIFGADSAWLILLVVAVMVFAASWIALNTVPGLRWRLLGHSIVAIALGGGFSLGVVTHLVLELDPWYLPRYLVPLAGMTFANAMTAVSLAAERVQSELRHGATWNDARMSAFNAAMIPVLNSLFAVGLVALPGMMTGQILSGISPLVAARYQIMIMCLIFAASGCATALFLHFGARVLAPTRSD